MTTLVIKARHIAEQISTTAVQGYLYHKPSADEYRVRQIYTVISELTESKECVINLEDIEGATLQDFQVAGFRVWDEADLNGKVLVLIPIWLFPFLDKTLSVSSISYLDNDKARTIVDLGKDLDSRDGALAYGFLTDAISIEE